MNIAKKYKDLRGAVALKVVQDFVEIYPEHEGFIKLTDIDGKALNYLDRDWVQHPDPTRSVGTPDEWRTTLDKYRQNYSSRIELAIWHGEKLCALVLGKPSRGKLILKINFLEGNHDESPIDGLRLRLATIYAEYFAAALEIQWVGIQSPYEGAIHLYHDEGYTEPDPFDYANDALCKSLEGLI